VAVDWAGQWLAAPRWWRTLRDAGATMLAVVCLAALATVMAEADGPVALSGAAGCLPLAAYWTWRQARHARMLIRLAPGMGEPAPSRGLAVRALAAFLAAGSAAAALVIAADHERAAIADCPRFTIDAPVREWWTRDRFGCPAGDTLVGAAGVRYTPWTVPAKYAGRRPEHVAYVPPEAGAMLLPMAIFNAWTAEGGPSGRLGQPVDSGADLDVAYVNFHGGAIVWSAGAPPKVQWGQRYAGAREPGSACVPDDRPCVTTAYADADGIHLRWQYGEADAFNVAWWPRDELGSATGREVAGYEVTLSGLRPSTVYLVEVAACRKRFLQRSDCTRPSARVIVRVR